VVSHALDKPDNSLQKYVCASHESGVARERDLFFFFFSPYNAWFEIRCLERPVDLLRVHGQLDFGTLLLCHLSLLWDGHNLDPHNLTDSEEVVEIWHLEVLSGAQKEEEKEEVEEERRRRMSRKG